MQRGNGGRVAIPAIEQFTEAMQSEMEMGACAGLRHGPHALLTLTLSSGGEATILLDELGASYLFEAAKALFPTIASGDASRAIIGRTPEGDIQVQVGHKSG